MHPVIAVLQAFSIMIFSYSLQVTLNVCLSSYLTDLSFFHKCFDELHANVPYMKSECYSGKTVEVQLNNK